MTEETIMNYFGGARPTEFEYLKSILSASVADISPLKPIVMETERHFSEDSFALTETISICQLFWHCRIVLTPVNCNCTTVLGFLATLLKDTGQLRV